MRKYIVVVLPVILGLTKLFSDFICFTCFHDKIKPSCTTKLANIILFNKQHTFRSKDIFDLVEYLDDPRVWYIVDGQPPLQVYAKTILLCSPQKQHYKEFDKMVGTTIRFMPVWSWNEVT